MCDSLLNLIDVGTGGKLKINAILEPAWAPPKDIIITYFILDSSYKKYLEEARDALNEDVVEEEPLPTEQDLDGYVIQLKRDPHDDERTIKMIATTKEISNILPVKTTLDEDIYQMAIEAHRTQQKISIKRRLEKVGRFWYLRNPSNLKIEEEESRPEKALNKFK
jgi:hypothetical protein